jgi:hypothetical protein
MTGLFMTLDAVNAVAGRASSAAGSLATEWLHKTPRAALADFGIQVATTHQHRSRAADLLNRMYGWRGYGRDHQIPEGEGCTTFVAAATEGLVGTLTLTVDSAAGLAADRTFGDLLDTFRAAPGSSICELTKFAFDASTPARPRLAHLFHAVLIYGSAKHHCTDLFIEVNPRHRAFYQAMLGFRPVGDARTNESVQAPSHLLWLSVDAIRANISRHREASKSSSRSLYPYFLREGEEAALAMALDGIEGTRAIDQHPAGQA